MAAPRARPSEIHRRPTPHPGFDVAKFARDSERRMHAAEQVAEEKTPTGPPPPYHPASMPPSSAQPPACSAAPPVLPPSLEAQLRDGQARASLARAELAVGRLSRDEAIKVLRLEVGAVEASARGSRALALAAWLADLGHAMEDLREVATLARAEPLRSVVVDDDAQTRQRIALAVESLGHSARTFRNVRELSTMLEHPPDMVFISAAMAGEDPEAAFCAVIRELARSETAHVVVYATAARSDLERIARERGARHWFCPSPATVEALAAQLEAVIADLAW